MSRKSCIVLLSGGLDSALSLAEVVITHDVKLALTFNYGQRAFSKELEASEALASHYKVPHHVLSLPWYRELLPEAMNAEENFDWTKTTSQNESFFEAKPVWIPNRNGVMLNIAAAFAEAHEANTVVFGANAEEGERFPDNTEAYRDKVATALHDSTLTHVDVLCPVGAMTKSMMVVRAQEIGLPLRLIWSCYTDNNSHCGRCPSCFRLERALGSMSRSVGIRFSSEATNVLMP